MRSPLIILLVFPFLISLTGAAQHAHLGDGSSSNKNALNGFGYHQRKSVDQIMSELESSFSEEQKVGLAAVLQKIDMPWTEYETVAQVVLESNLDSGQLFWVWIQWWKRGVFKIVEFNKAEWILKVFMKSVEGGDLRIVKFIVDYCFMDSNVAILVPDVFLSSYLKKYRLTHTPNVDERLRRAVSLLEIHAVFDTEMSYLLPLLFTDYPKDHPLATKKISFKVYNSIPVEYWRAVFLGYFLIPNAWHIDLYGFRYSTGILQAIKEGCDSSGIDMIEHFHFCGDNLPVISLLRLNDYEDSEPLLEQCFALESQDRNRSFTSSFLLYVHSRWPHKIYQWAEKISVDDMLVLAWRKPLLLPLVKLPNKMPFIVRLIPPFKPFGFEKGLYLESIIAKYGYDAINQAMIERKIHYHWSSFFVIESIAFKDVPINWDSVAKCLPESMDDIMDWTGTLLRIHNIPSEAREALPEVLIKSVVRDNPMDIIPFLRFIIPKLGRRSQ